MSEQVKTGGQPVVPIEESSKPDVHGFLYWFIRSPNRVLIDLAYLFASAFAIAAVYLDWFFWTGLVIFVLLWLLGVFVVFVRMLASVRPNQKFLIQLGMEHLEARTLFTLAPHETAIDEDFSRLTAEWRDQSRFMSSIIDMVLIPAYQRIIGMGRDVVPLLLRDLQRDDDEPAYWFWALTAITGADPVPDESRGDINAMTAAWVAWGEQEGYLKHADAQPPRVSATRREQQQDHEPTR